MSHSDPMDESPPRVARKDWTSKPKDGPTRKNSSCSRYTVDDGGDLIECSGKYCRSCSAGLIADCVAICCCPCAVFNILALVFVKFPYMVGRRCLASGKKKEKRKFKKSESGFVVERNGNLMTKKENLVDERMLEIVSSEFVEDQEKIGDVSDSASARFEAEKIWFELYQIGHLGFGRVSFSG